MTLEQQRFELHEYMDFFLIHTYYNTTQFMVGWNHGYGGPSVKLYVNIQLPRGGGVCPESHVVQGSTVFDFTVDFPSETMEAWKNRTTSLKFLLGVGMGVGCQTRIPYQVKISFKNESELEIILDKGKLRIQHQKICTIKNDTILKPHRHLNRCRKSIW